MFYNILFHLSKSSVIKILQHYQPNNQAKRGLSLHWGPPILNCSTELNADENFSSNLATALLERHQV